MSLEKFIRTVRFRFNNWRMRRLHKQCDKLMTKK
ncbi:hypothetical protein JA33_271 [Dickeya phage vB_DsoM_JA33]|uniref:Uncharacterized protein n=2 Tax=Salmondvirus JA11 TaxID=2734141 RepID=A0A386K5V5_9CAUD|nr:hypothetical protein HOU32_gp270 [Dickeya phage vB_DsoM_JA11]AXG67645.1 hypothetical protein JA33_271 [Dickeya phage vB_DsoM_JA33]AYD80075.1 hypothetical protein JA11_270 [Dickeya phage vB_DsoM_JA11]